MIRLGTKGNGEESFLNVSKFLKSHTFLQGMTGSGKTTLLLKIHEGLSEKEIIDKFGDIQMIYLDFQDEFTKIPEFDKRVLLISRKNNPDVFDVDHAEVLGNKIRHLEKSVVVKLTDLSSESEQQAFVANFITGLRSMGKEIGHPCILVIDEADIVCPTKANKLNVVSRDVIINACKRARKQNIAMVIATQFSSEVDIRARRECANRIIGKTTELRDRRAVAELLGDPKIQDKFFSLEAGSFFVRGTALTDEITQIKVDNTNIERIVAGELNNENSPKDERSDWAKVLYPKSGTKPIENLVSDVVKSDDKRSYIEILESKIEELEKQLKVSKSRELTDRRRQEIVDLGFNEGIKYMKEQWSKMSKLEKIFS